MKNDFKISVITPSYNKGTKIERAIKSVLSQDYKNWEHIIVDGKSTDNTLEILKKYKHLKWKSEKDNGQADAMNKGFKMSRGQIIVYLNADDYFYPNAFSTVIEEFKKGAKFVVGNVFVKSKRMKNEFLNVPKTTLNEMLRIWESNAFCYNPVGYFYLREVQVSCPFNVKNTYTMDIEFLLDAASKYKFNKIDFTLGYFEDGRDTKTFVSQSRLDYWQISTFPYLEKHLRKLTPQDRFTYEYDMRTGFANVQGYMNQLNKKEVKLLNPNDIPLISVIIPTYNSANYITKAIDALLNQGLNKLEIIVTDDCSTDNTIEILEKRYGNNSMVKVFKNKENLKPGATRNICLNYATGKYVFFQDADDWLNKGALIHLASIALTYNAEIVACGIDLVKEDFGVTPYHSLAFSCRGGVEALNYFADNKIGSIIWNKLYSRELIERIKLRFIAPYINDDVVFSLNAIYSCNNYISISDRYYNYFQKPDSVIRSNPTIVHLRSYINIYKEFYKFIEKNKINNGAQGEILASRLIRAHCSNDVMPKLILYTESRSKEQFEKECFEASKIELGDWGFVFADFLFAGLPNALAIHAKYQESLNSIYNSRGWKLLMLVRKIANKLFPSQSFLRKSLRVLYNIARKIISLFHKY